MGVPIFLWRPAFNSLGYIFRSWIALSCGNSISYFLRNFYTVFYSGCNILQFHQQSTRVLVSPHPLQPHYYLIFWSLGARWYLTMVSIGIFLMINDIKHLFICFLANYLSLEKYPLKSFAYFNQLICHWLARVLYILDINHLSNSQINFECYTSDPWYKHWKGVRAWFLIICKAIDEESKGHKWVIVSQHHIVRLDI